MGHYDCPRCDKYPTHCECHKLERIEGQVERRIQIETEKPKSNDDYLKGRVNFGRVDASRQLLYTFLQTCEGIYIEGEKAFLYKSDKLVATLTISGDQDVFARMLEALYD